MSDANPTKITAALRMEMNTTCPHCEEYFDLFEIDYLNDEGRLSKLISDRYFADRDLWKNIDVSLNCPRCKAKLTFDELEY